MNNRLDWTIEPLVEDFIWPKRATSESAAYDLFYHGEALTIELGKVYSVPLSFKSKISRYWSAEIFIRSGMAKKEDLTLANSTALIDSDYRGEWILLIRKNSGQPFKLEHGFRIAQVTFKAVPHVNLVHDKVSDDSERNKGAFGSTGIK